MTLAKPSAEYQLSRPLQALKMDGGTGRMMRTSASTGSLAASLRTRAFGGSFAATGDSWLTRATAAAPRRYPDLCYDHLVVDGQLQGRGPGSPAAWPLGHESEYPCCLGDMDLALRLRDAYDVGFRARKRDKPNAVQLAFGDGAAPRLKTVTPVEEAFCDACGTHIEDVTTSSAPRAFWFCKRCKRSGNRYELCLACHAAEVLQGEGKHSSTAVAHPHFQRCEHRSLVKRKDVRTGQPGMPHIRKAFCDYCGRLVSGGPSHPGRSSPESEVYTCPTCPEEHGLRFELCAGCARSFLDHGRGMQRIIQ